MTYVPTGNWDNLIKWEYIKEFWNEYSTNIKNKVKFNSNSWMSLLPNSINYTVSLDYRSDPAPGCVKNFQATYQCGNKQSPTKTISIPGEALGQLANFNCSAEGVTCNNLKLTLSDEGRLTLSTTTGTTVIWDSVTNGSKPTIPENTVATVLNDIPNDKPLAIPDFAGDGQPHPSVDVEAGGGPGRRYPFNYLLPGEFLEKGQWIGSPKGTCRLIMGTPDEPTTLKVITNILGCGSLDEGAAPSSSTTFNDLGCWNDNWNRALSIYTGNVNNADECKKRAIDRGSDTFGLQYYGECWVKQPGDDYKKYGMSTNTCTALGGGWQNHVYGPNIPGEVDTKASRLYTVGNIHNEHIGKVAYVNNTGQLQMYPSTMTTYNANFEKIGNYNISSGATIGSPINSSNITSCQAECATSGDTQTCAGFVFDTTTARCQLLNNKMTTKNRIIDGNKEYYVRSKIVKGQHTSCPVDVTVQNTEFLNSNTVDPTVMTPTTKCGLANFVEKESNQIAADLPSIYNDLEYKDTTGKVAKNIKFKDMSGNTPLINANKNSFKYWYESLQDKYATLKSQLFNTKNSTEATFAELQDSRQNLADWTGEQLQNLTAMNEDRDLNMMSQNYRHIMWSILAIIIIIGTMKFTKSVASSGAAV
jgi:hypothetical protein